MNAKTSTSVVNSSESKFISDVLKLLINLPKFKENDEHVNSTTKEITGAKGIEDIILQVGTSVAGTFVFELIKFLILQLKHRNDFDPKLTITICDTKITLDQIGSTEIIVSDDKVIIKDE